jgi:hypothetical protein
MALIDTDILEKICDEHNLCRECPLIDSGICYQDPLTMVDWNLVVEACEKEKAND